MQSVGVIGGGLMGSGIAYTVLLKSPATVTIVDQTEELLAASRTRMERLISTGIKRGAVSEALAAQIRDRVRYTPDFNAVAPAGLVVEAVFENLGVKQKVFEQLDRICSPAAILASNTSGISITEIARASKNPGRVVGTHFFNPVPVMKLVELVRGDLTTDDTVAAARRFCEELGKEVVVSRDRPGFITTRIGQAYQIGRAHV